jgi:outer membrane protein assembly factor BamD
MLNKLKYPLLLALISLILFSCSEYQQILKSNNLQLKYEAAMKYFEQEKYYKASPLFEELIPLWRGTQKGQEVYYYYCYCNYYQGYYAVAAYHFKKFSQTYPNSEHAEECYFMNGYCNYLMSPTPTLDQTNTYHAIDELQLFVNHYPNSNLVDSCNALIDKLRDKLETKAFLNAKLYHQTMYYKSAIVALNNVLKDYPNSKHKKEILFLILDSNYQLAINSVEAKKEERIKNTIEAYYKLVDLYHESEKDEYLYKAKNIYKKIIEFKEQTTNS